MSDRADVLVRQFTAINDETIAAVQGFSAAQWGAVSAGEGWPVGTTAHHLAGTHGMVMGLTEGLAQGQPLPPVTWDMIHGGNAQHAQDHAAPDQGETVALLRRTGEDVAGRIGALSDEQLDRASPWGLAEGASRSAEQLITLHIIEHAQGHLASMRQAAGG